MACVTVLIALMLGVTHMARTTAAAACRLAGSASGDKKPSGSCRTLLIGHAREERLSVPVPRGSETCLASLERVDKTIERKLGFFRREI